MSPGVRPVIFCIFSTIGVSFLITTGVLAWEFWRHDWLTVANFYSHLFIFFPTFGIVTLIAFYTPACVFLDIYLRHVRWGRRRFIFGLLVTAVLSVVFARMLVGSNERSIFEVKPEVLRADVGETGDCGADGPPNTQCDRLPVMVAVDNVRRVSQSRIGLSDLARNCRPDTLKEIPLASNRYCFVSTRLPEDMSKLTADQRIGDPQCCAAQVRFTRAVKSMHDSPGGQSVTSLVHAALLPFKIFFALILLIISVLLAVRRKTMVEFYPSYINGIERGVLVGAIAMVIYPIMSHAFLRSAALLYFGSGPSGGFRATAPLFSFMLGLWGLLLLFFFYSQRDKDLQTLARMGGLVGSAVAVVKYDLIIDIFVRLVGSGADWFNIGVLFALAGGALMALVVKTSEELEGAEAVELSTPPPAMESGGDGD